MLIVSNRSDANEEDLLNRPAEIMCRYNVLVRDWRVEVHYNIPFLDNSPRSSKECQPISIFVAHVNMVVTQNQGRPNCPRPGSICRQTTCYYGV